MQNITRRDLLSGCAASLAGFTLSRFARADEEGDDGIPVAGKIEFAVEDGWVRVALKVSATGASSQFRATLWVIEDKGSGEQKRGLVTLGPYAKGFAGFSKAIRTRGGKYVLEYGGANAEFRLQAQFRDHNGSTYANKGEQTGKL
ncbi:MAG: hypothetical protein GC159_09740 [Phycisphaera sp.]|nr:hypothetical protein [Phycisphaera sp.]